jgi:protocatechuate 3,4-dioxygenase beta subunit
MIVARHLTLLLAAAALAGGAAAAGCGGGGRSSSGPATATVEGWVVGPQGGPVAGASVELAAGPPDRPAAIAAASTGKTGSFHLRGIPAGIYRIRARSAGLADASARVVVAPPAAVRATLRLDTAVALAGRIEDRRGAPVPLARVRAIGASADPGAMAEMRGDPADTAGRFEIPNLSPGSYRLLIEAPGLGMMQAGPVAAPDRSLLITLEGESRSLVGSVTGEGRPAIGARVLLGGEAMREPRIAETDAGGRFAFAGIGPGAYVLRAEAGSAVAPIVSAVVGDSPELAAAPPLVALVLVTGTSARGRVVDERGGGVPDAVVEIDTVPATGLWPPIRSDSAGAWTSPPLAPGTYRIRARRAGFVARRTATVNMPGQGAPVTLELARMGTLTGRVLDEQGAPLGGATVHDRLAESEELGVIWSPLPPAAEAAASGAGPPIAVSTGVGTRRATTGGDGRFALGDVPPGRVRIEVLHPRVVPFRTGTLVVAPGQRLDVGTLKVHAAARIQGLVVDADGSPIAGAKVTAAPAGGDAAGVPGGAGDALYALTAGDGSFSLPLPSGAHRVTASVAGRTQATVEIRVDPGARALPPVTLRLAKGDQSVEGVVRDSQGRPLARAHVAVRAAPTPEAAAATATRGELPLAAAVADAGGHFRLVGLPAAALAVEVRHPSYATFTRTFVPGGLLAVEVPVPGGIDGEVHERITGAPVPGFELSAQGPAGASAVPTAGTGGRRRGSPDPAARFSLRQLVPGSWTLRVRAPGYRDLERAVEVPAASMPGEPSVRDLRLDLDR